VGAWQDGEVGNTPGVGLDTTFGKRPSLALLNHPWWTGSGYVTFASIATEFSTARANGQVPLLGWQTTAWSGTPSPALTLANISSGLHESFIQTFADGVAALGYPILILLDEEMNGPWNPAWYDATGVAFVAMWQHVVDVFRARGATNANWVWCANGIAPGGSLAAWWPGASYVDWAAVDVFNTGYSKASAWITFDQILHGDGSQWGDSWTALQGLDTTGKVRLGLGSFGSENRNATGVLQDKAAWVRDAFGTQIPNASGAARDYSRLEFVMWWNQNESNAGLTACTTAADGHSPPQEHWDMNNDANSLAAARGTSGPGQSAYYTAGSQLILPSGMGKLLPLAAVPQISKLDTVIMGTAPSRLQGFWKLNEAAGTTAADSSGNARNGTYNGGFTLGQPRVALGTQDTCTLFNGSTGYVSIADNDIWSLHQAGAARTFMIVFKMIALPAAQASLLSQASATDFAHALRVSSGGVLEGIAWDLTGATWVTAATAGGVISTGVTYVALMTYDRTRTPIGRLGYGALGGSLNTVASTDAAATPGNSVGNLEIARRGVPDHYSNASISHVAVWDVALSDVSMNEILKAANARREKPRNYVG
jgi:hypothetical protein